MAVAYRIAVLVGFAAACSGPGAPPPETGARVVSLHDVTTELVVALGATDRLVGVAEPVDVEAGTGAAIAGVPRVGDLESILAVRPAIVVGLAVVAAQDPELVARLREAGVAVYLAEPTTLDDVFALIRAMAERVGAGPAGQRLAAKLEQEASAPELRSRAAPPAGAPVAAAPRTVAHPTPTAELAPRIAQPTPAAGFAPPPHRVRVFVYDCCDPPFTAGGKAVLNDLIARAGGDNIFGDLDAAWTHVSWEEVVARRPELVVIHAYRHDGQGDAADKRRAVQAISALARLPTVVIPLGCSLGGLRSLEGLARLRSAIAAIGGRA